ncbi:chromate efflux transporter [Sphingomonas faeni]|uniref:chromate efflux transporter n=1 Tax=Sphingomonas faeni TaxID=185950 RepID=UPI0020C129AC|nr:chromate efflux transporter [Sphingomonas faeni]MCK8458423.1 chromate efflux transporter [Sphingomonas faeni]
MTNEQSILTHRGRVGEVFAAFLKLGLTSFGGPIAHLGYFREAFVVRRRWIDEAGYADLVALCQFLPGPASSQVGFALGLLRAGPLGAVAAWVGFTFPSACLMLLFAYGASRFDGPLGIAVIHGLNLVAVAVVAQAVWGMARTLTPDRSRTALALAALVTVTLLGGAWGQVAAIGVGAMGGIWLCRTTVTATRRPIRFKVSRTVGVACLALFALLLVGLPLFASTSGLQGLALFDAFYRSGALVFGGGHVVLPLLQAAVVEPGWTDDATFLAGYGVAQAVPGPLFTFAAYLGAVIAPVPRGILGAAVALVAIFLPGLLILIGALPFWDALRARPAAQAALRGVNAAVVGILAAALYNPVWVSAVVGPYDFAIAAAGFGLLTVWRLPPIAVVALMTSLAVAWSI